MQENAESLSHSCLLHDWGLRSGARFSKKENIREAFRNRTENKRAPDSIQVFGVCVKAKLLLGLRSAPSVQGLPVLLSLLHN